MIIGVPTGAIQCSQPAPVKQRPVRVPTVAHVFTQLFTSAVVELLVRGFVPKSLKRLAAYAAAIAELPRELRAPFCFSSTIIIAH